ncbi:two-component sensor histidine kinase [Nocardioides flavus (ex Wang et al. 2016)]|uniref:histidine kinase n=1 Tax=Nocardioides flavus (ex Wang et al. 2016) TaxID=2058780 RepID=A0ABQ3HPT9_9ACTN|nr:ATP-binding protein [Nocardioides flavus (ex Wang et al. 2016)]GHE18918.1 two-component sensor histidine kinase [Nocardioides flavus (ex Wang et al. 2016)]
MNRRRFRGVRWRTTAAATLAVAVFLALAGLAFAFAQRQQLEASITEAAQQQAADIAGQVAQDGAGADLATGAGDQSLVQIVDAGGNVLAASPSVEGEPPVVDTRPGPGSTSTVRSAALPIGEGEDFVVVALGVSGPDGPVVVLVAQSLELVGQSTAVVVTLLLIGYPVVLLGVAATSYWLAGRALAPVEAIRARVAQVQGTSELDARVPVPEGDDEIAALAVTMNAMLERLESGSERQRRFVGDASHELRSPLATIRAAHEIAALHPGSRDWSSTSRDVLAELDRLDHLVADLLLLARVDEHGLRVRSVDVDLDDLVSLEAERLRKLGALTVTVAAPPVRIKGDPVQLARALRNLADNAARHAEGHIDLTLQRRGNEVEVAIEDDGSGIPLADRERVFERFVRLDESRTRASGGTGLGLAIAREISTAHGGSLSVEAGARGGARFVLLLPCESRVREAAG